MIELKPLVVKSGTSGVSDEVTVPVNCFGLLELDVRAKSGTNPTLDVVVQAEVSGKWFQVAKFSQMTDSGAKVLPLALHDTDSEVALADDPAVSNGAAASLNAAPYKTRLRVKWGIGGTNSPTFTFAVRLHPVPSFPK